MHHGFSNAAIRSNITALARTQTDTGTWAYSDICVGNARCHLVLTFASAAALVCTDVVLAACRVPDLPTHTKQPGHQWKPAAHAQALCITVKNLGGCSSAAFCS